MKVLRRFLLVLLLAALVFSPVYAENNPPNEPNSPSDPADSQPDSPDDSKSTPSDPKPDSPVTPKSEDQEDDEPEAPDDSKPEPSEDSQSESTPDAKPEDSQDSKPASPSDSPPKDTQDSKSDPPAAEEDGGDDAKKDKDDPPQGEEKDEGDEGSKDEDSKDENEKDDDSDDEDEDDGDGDDQIEAAPKVDELPGAVGDLDIDGPCAEDISTFCSSIKPGGSHLAECIQNQIKDEEQGATEFTAQITETCKAELLSYKMKLVRNINMDKERRKACKKDAQELCQADVLASESVPGKVITCLTEARPRLSKKCAESIYEAQLEAAQDYRLNAVLYSECQDDADRICAHVEPGEGRVHACLRDHRSDLRWECQAELFKMDVQDADDIRLNVKLFRTCLTDKRKFCADVAPGNGRATACLEEHRNDSGFSSDCKDEIEKMMEARTQDFRLDPALRADCKEEMNKFCPYQMKSMTEVKSDASGVVECLQDYSDDIENPACKAAVARTFSRGSANIRFAVVMAKACKDDRDKFCQAVPPGDARVIRCLEESREQLTTDCRVAMFDHMTRMSEDIDFNKPLKDACSSEIKQNCANVNPGHSRVVRCLQDGKRKKYSDKCKKELQRMEKEMGRDYRVNYRLEDACSRDVDSLCGADVCNRAKQISCGGTVLRCLVDKKEEIKAESCKQEVYYYVKMEVTNFGNDIIMAEKCRQDVDNYCTDVEAGEGRVHACLRSHRDELSAGCAAEQLRLEIEESSSFELRTNLKKACASEREVFCSEMRTGQARVFRCLVHNLGKADFGETCKKEVKKKLARRQQNWKLDVTLRQACKADAAEVCSDVDHDADHAEVTRCLMRNHDSISEACLHEVSRAAYMALYVWQPDAPLSAMCGSDAEFCVAKNPLVEKYPGKIMDCLTTMSGRGGNTTAANLKSKLSEDCDTILSIAQPPDIKNTFDTYFQKVSAMSTKEKMVHVGVWDQQSGVTITGYTALACFSALCTTVVMTTMFAFKKWRGIKEPSNGYVQVVKQGDV